MNEYKDSGKRVSVSGWVHRLRVQGKDMMFVIIRDGTGYLQCLLNGRLCHTFDALTLSVESSVVIRGQIKSVPEGNTVIPFFSADSRLLIDPLGSWQPRIGR